MRLKMVQLTLTAGLCISGFSPALAQTKIKASDVVINGESFFAAANITSELTRLARADARAQGRCRCRRGVSRRR